MNKSIPLDQDCPSSIRKNANVYQEQNNIYDVTLNQTNILQNNNKYYVIQLLESKNIKVHQTTTFGQNGVVFQKSPVPVLNMKAQI